MGLSRHDQGPARSKGLAKRLLRPLKANQPELLLHRSLGQVRPHATLLVDPLSTTLNKETY